MSKVKRTKTLQITTSSLEKLLDIIDYSVAPYLESDEYDNDHWSRMLKKQRDSFLESNDLETVTPE